MTRWRVALSALAILTLACPERATPPRGTVLTFRKPAPGFVRSTVDHRLAQLGLKTQLQEDERTLTVRVPTETSVAEVKGLLRLRARLEFCEVDARTAAPWCAADAGVDVRRDGDGCRLTSTARAPLDMALGDGGVPARVGLDERAWTAWAVHEPCLTPRVVAAKPQAEGSEFLSLTFDREGAAAFGALTTRLKGRLMLVVLDDVVLAAPRVLDAITAGRAMLMAPGSDDERRLLAAALAGGELPALELVSEKPYGPPSLR